MLEIIIETIDDAKAAIKGGATQIVIHSAFTENGLTPSIGMVKHATSLFNIETLIMIRPHSRSMILTPDDLEIMVTDIELYTKYGADGFVLGAITNDGEIDKKSMKAFSDASGKVSLHCHLGWEMTNNIEKSLEELIDLGVKSVRTTGGFGPGGKALDGIKQLNKIRNQADGRIDLFLAGGVGSDNIKILVSETRILHAHAGSSVRIPPTPKGVVSEEKVRNLRQELDKVTGQILL